MPLFPIGCAHFLDIFMYLMDLNKSLFGWIFEKPLLVKDLLAVDLLEIEFFKKKS